MSCERTLCLLIMYMPTSINSKLKLSCILILPLVTIVIIFTQFAEVALPLPTSKYTFSFHKVLSRKLKIVILYNLYNFSLRGCSVEITKQYKWVCKGLCFDWWRKANPYETLEISNAVLISGKLIWVSLQI